MSVTGLFQTVLTANPQVLTCTVNLYENRFSEALALGAYSCEGRTGAKVLTTSPG